MKSSADSKFKGERISAPKPVDRLERMLQVWEDLSEMKVLNEHYLKITKQPPYLDGGLLKNHRKLRQALLNTKDFGSFPFIDFTQAFVQNRPEAELNTLITETVFPLFLAQWTSESRRVYEISEDLLLVLLSTKLGNLTWKDISLPFESFCISLPVSFKPLGSNIEYDFVMVNHVTPDTPHFSAFSETPMLDLTLLPKSAGNFSGLPKSKWDKAHEALDRGDGETTRRIASPAYDKARKRNMQIHALHEYDDGRTLAELFPADTDEDKLARLVLGFCLYLSTLSSKKKSTMSEWKKTGRSPASMDMRAITDESQVCNVLSNFALSPDEREGLRDALLRNKGGYELPAGWRTAHWRRRAGEGHIPEAPRAVHVNAARVRHDRLGDGALPGGAHVDVE